MNKLSLRLSLLVAFTALPLSAQDNADSARPDGEERYLMRYQFSEGEELRWKITHLATTETRIQGNTQSSKSRSVSTKLWHVESISEDGEVTLTHLVESVDMWQKLSDRPEVRYNSEKDDSVPTEYEHVASTVGVPLTKVTINGEGRMLRRESGQGQPNFGLGDIVMLLPPKPVRVGGNWYEPAEMPLREANGQVKKVKVRKLYTLKKVQTGVATIDVRTEVLTPIREASLRAQLVQQLVNGTIKFDIDAGRVLSKQMDWDESVVGFSGPESMMKYLARFSEEFVPVTKTAALP